MTQLDLPQISVQRYVELLKRRRWQVVPASLFGLLLGGLIAFFIPRYFVASTLVEHQLAPGMERRGKEDPFRGIVDSAQVTIPLAIAETIKKLEWPEAAATDPSVRSENEREIRGRLDINDFNARLDRDYLQLRITYKDRDGQRSAAFLNTLVEVWIAQRLAELRAGAEQVRSLAADHYGKLNAAYDQLLAERQHLETEYGIDPRLDLVEQRLAQRRMATEQKERADSLALKQASLQSQQQLLESLRTELSLTDKRLPLLGGAEDPAGGPAAELRIQIFERMTEIQYWQRTQKNFKDHTATYRGATRRIAELEDQLAELGAAPGVDTDFNSRLNPRYLELEAQIKACEAEIERLQVEIKALQVRIAEEAARLLRLAEGFALYTPTVNNLEDARLERERALAAKVQADRELGRLQNEQTVRQAGGKVFPPPRPTDPNIMVVALIGCVLGLGFAIALILLLDVLQGTFKTIDEIERSLAVPVLGGMSHLETDVQRQRLQRGRRRWSLFAAALLFLSVVVITVYYLDPTRLPPAVRDALAMLLGA